MFFMPFNTLEIPPIAVLTKLNPKSALLTLNPFSTPFSISFNWLFTFLSSKLTSIITLPSAI